MHEGKTYYGYPAPVDLNTTKAAQLQKLGMSMVKAKAILCAADYFLDPLWIEQITNPSTSIDRLYELLTGIFGVGDWTASWFILRGLRRFEHVPAGDLVMRKAMSWWYKSDELMAASDIDERAQSIGYQRGIITYRIMLAYMQKTNTP